MKNKQKNKNKNPRVGRVAAVCLTCERAQTSALKRDEYIFIVITFGITTSITSGWQKKQVYLNLCCDNTHIDVVQKLQIIALTTSHQNKKGPLNPSDTKRNDKVLLKFDSFKYYLVNTLI